ncbi:MAG: hypothetical protein PVI57_06870 [Gemmatimonadota bacterium]|jgi:hypothetical protein
MTVRRLALLLVSSTALVGCFDQPTSVDGESSAPPPDAVAPETVPDGFSPALTAAMTETVEEALQRTGIEPEATMQALDEFIREVNAERDGRRRHR